MEKGTLEKRSDLMNRGVFEVNKGLVCILGSLAFPSTLSQIPQTQSSHSRTQFVKENTRCPGAADLWRQALSTGHSQKERVPLPIAEICKERRKQAAGVTGIALQASLSGFNTQKPQ